MRRFGAGGFAASPYVPMLIMDTRVEPAYDEEGM